jgi:protein SCO1/2
VSPLLLRLCGFLLVGLGIALAAATYVSDDETQKTATTEELVGPRMPENLPAHDFTLRDQRGKDFTLSEDSAGRVVAMTFIHSKCTSTCPVTLQTIRGALNELGPERDAVDVLAVTVDPEADTRRSVTRFLRGQHADDFVRYLTGPRATLTKIWKRYGIQPQGSGQEDHTAFVLLRDRRGVLRIGFPSHQMTAEDLEHDLRLLAQEPA